MITRLAAWARGIATAIAGRAPGRASARRAALDALQRAAVWREHGERALAAGALDEAIRLAGPLDDEVGRSVLLQAWLDLAEQRRVDDRGAEAAELFRRCVELSARVPDPLGRLCRASALSRLGIIEHNAGRLDEARARYEESLRLGRGLVAPRLRAELAQAAFHLGLIAAEREDSDGACAHWREAIELGASSGQAAGRDPAAIAAFNLGHERLRAGSADDAREAYERSVALAEEGRTPLGGFAGAKSAFALAELAEREELLAPERAAEWFERAAAFGRRSALPEARQIGGQAEIGLGELRARERRFDEAIAHFRAALDVAPEPETESAGSLIVFARMRLGVVLAESGAREQGAEELRRAYADGRTHSAAAPRELAAQAACNLHRLLSGLGRWDEARELIAEAVAFASTLGPGVGRALEAAASNGLALQCMHDGDAAGTAAALDRAIQVGRESDSVAGDHEALDAALLAGNLSLQAERAERAIDSYRLAIEIADARPGAAEFEGKAAQAQCNIGHGLLALDRHADACRAYERALARGRASGQREGRAAAANAALNLGALLEGEAPIVRRRELFGVAIALGRSSGTPLGLDCVRNGERAIAALEHEDGDPLA